MDGFPSVEETRRITEEAANSDLVFISYRDELAKAICRARSWARRTARIVVDPQYKPAGERLVDILRSAGWTAGLTDKSRILGIGIVHELIVSW